MYSKAQLKAIEHYKGPCLVLAGPGSGKTTVITKRTQNLIEKYKVNPSNILVVTFTKAAAREMKERFEKMTGSNKVVFATFHSLFFTILKYTYNYSAANVVSPERQWKIITEYIYANRLEIEDENDFVSDILNEISKAKTAYENVDEYVPVSCGKNVFKDIFKYYSRSLEREKLIDFDDMMVYCYDLFSKRKDILSKWQSKYQYILIDEFQDINKIQYDIMKMLASPLNNMFIVGDDDQSIYGFRGSDTSIMLGFENDYPNAKKILLDINYRSTANISEASLRLIGNNKQRFNKLIKTAKDRGEDVEIKFFADSDEEYEDILKSVQDRIKEGYSYSDIAILFRTNAMGRQLLEKFAQYSIPFKSRDVIPNIYEHFTAKNVFAYIKAATGDLSRKNILNIINKPSRYISRDCLDEETVNFEHLRNYYSEKNFILDHIDKLEEDLKLIQDLPPFAAINYIRRGVGYDDYIHEYCQYRKLDYNDTMDILNEIQDNSRHYMTYEQWFSHIEEYKQQLSEDKGRENDYDAVTFSTMHSAKGLEFKIVYIIDAVEGMTPYKKAVMENELEEERRMFYVAMTRAKDRLCITCPLKKKGKKLEISRFLSEITLQKNDDML